jgi:hypothetical protein
MKIAYTAVFEQESNGGWAAYVPDLPIVLVSADTREEAERLWNSSTRKVSPFHRPPSRPSRLKSPRTPEALPQSH